MLLPDADVESVESVLDRLRLVLMQAAAEKGAPVTVSLGAATFQRPQPGPPRSHRRGFGLGPPRMKPSLAALLVLLLDAARAGASEPPRPFLFTTVAPIEERGWVAHYDAGYSERADATVSENGFEQRLGVQGRLGHGLTLL
jgi:hypothetical protein